MQRNPSKTPLESNVSGDCVCTCVDVGDVIEIEHSRAVCRVLPAFCPELDPNLE